MRYVAVVLGILAALVLLVVGILAWVASTEQGTQFAWQRVRALLPDGVEVGAVRGRLAGPLLVEEVSVRAEGFTLSIDDVDLAWRPAALFSGLLHVHRLVVTGVQYVATPVPEPLPDEPGFQLPERVDLPVDVIVEELIVTEAEFRSAPEAEPIVVDELALAAAFEDSRLSVRGLEAEGPLFEMAGELSVRAADDYPIALQLDWRLRLPEYAPVVADTALDGTLRELTLRQSVDAPYRLAAEVRVAEPLDELRLQANLEVEDAALAQIQRELPAARISLVATAEGALDDLQVMARVRSASAAGDAELTGEGSVDLVNGVRGDLDIAWSRLRWPLTGEAAVVSNEGRAQVRGTPAELTAELAAAFGANGHVEGQMRRDGESFDVALDWEDLAYPIADPSVRSPSGTVLASGSLSDYTFALDARLVGPTDLEMTTRVEGRGNRDAADVELTANLPEGRVRGEVDVAWSPEVAWSANLSGSEVNPGVLAPEWPGRFGFDVQAAGSGTGDTLAVRVERLTADGTLRGRTLAVEARGRYANEAGTVEELVAKMGGSVLEAEGEIGERVDFTWRIESDRLETVLPDARGRIEGNGRVQGRWPQVDVIAELDGRSLSYGDFAASTVDLDSAIFMDGRQRSTLAVTLTGGRVGDVRLERIALEGAGTPAEHTLAFDATTSIARASADLRGAAQDLDGSDPRWEFTLEEAELEHPELDPWRLADSASGVVGKQVLRVSRHCWRSADGALCLGGERANGTLEAAFSLDALQLAALAPWLPGGLGVSGAVNGSGSIDQTVGEAPEAELSLRAEGVEVRAGRELATRQLLALEPSTVQLSLSEAGLRARVALDLAEGGIRLDARTARTQAPVMERPLEGRVAINLPNLDFIARLAPQVDDLTGRIRGALDLGGTPSDPQATGRLALEDGSMRLPDTGVHIENWTFALLGRGEEGFALESSAQSGGGVLEAEGTFDIVEGNPLASVRVDGESFQVMDTSDARIFVSPALAIDSTAERIEVRGVVEVPRAAITPETGQEESAVRASKDQILESHDPEEEGTAGEARALTARIRLALGDDVRFEGFGLEARFEGEVVLVEEPGAPTTATGELSIIDGEYRAYGQGLVIEEGRFLFAGGPVTEPALDVRAVRRPEEDILVGAHVRGTLENPEFTLFSEPAMTQQEQLSYLVLGRSLQAAPDGESSALSRAALSLGLRGGDFLARNIGERLGVDEFGIQTGTGEAGAASNPEEAELVIGKYLSPRLFVSYGIGLFDPVSVLRAEYEVTKNLELVTESSGRASGADVVYTFER